ASDGNPLAIDPIEGKRGWVSPRADYRVVPLTGVAKPLVIHEDFHKLIRQLVSPSVVEDWAVSRAALHFSQQLKHGLLAGDFFHLARVLYYGGAIMRSKAGWKGGWSVLDIADRNINEAVRRGVITEKQAAWGRELVPYGRTKITRRALTEKFYGQMGANLGRIQDALYKDLITNLSTTSGNVRRAIVRLIDPSVGRYNRFLFDKLTRGLMAESNVAEFERQMKARPNADPEEIGRA